MSADLFLYALVAAGLVFWLKNILGTRHGDEKQRHNPYAAESHKGKDKDDFAPESEEQGHTQEDQIVALASDPTDVISIDNKNAETGLIAISEFDRNFDIKQFMDAAQDAFVIIVESFGEGDRDTLSNLLAEPVYKAFSDAIEAREQIGNTMETEIHAIKKAQIIEAKLDKKMAYITIRFTASETSVQRDDEGEIVSGHPDKVTEMHDIWVFGRKIKSRDPRWLVYETRGDFEGDNETLPNAD